MTDKNEIIISLGKLDSLFNNMKISYRELNKEINRFKNLIISPDLKIEEDFIPEKFFNEFLKPLLERYDIMNKNELLNECSIQKKYESSNTINRYLHLLETNGFIDSKRIKNTKHYFLKKNSNLKHSNG